MKPDLNHELNLRPVGYFSIANGRVQASLERERNDVPTVPIQSVEMFEKAYNDFPDAIVVVLRPVLC